MLGDRISAAKIVGILLIGAGIYFLTRMSA
jgi:multidrug transporter EmrE-like cation transporter